MIGCRLWFDVSVKAEMGNLLRLEAMIETTKLISIYKNLEKNKNFNFYWPINQKSWKNRALNWIFLLMDTKNSALYLKKKTSKEANKKLSFDNYKLLEQNLW